MARFVSLLVLVAILVIISIIFFQVMAGFFVLQERRRPRPAPAPAER